MTSTLEPDVDNATVGRFFVFYSESTHFRCSLFFRGDIIGNY